MMTRSSICDIFGRWSIFCTLSNRINESSFLNFKSGVVAMASWWPVNKHSSQLSHSPFLIFLSFFFVVESSNHSFIHPPLMAPLRRWTPIKVLTMRSIIFRIKALWRLDLRSLWHVLAVTFKSYLNFWCSPPLHWFEGWNINDSSLEKSCRTVSVFRQYGCKSDMKFNYHLMYYQYYVVNISG